MGRHFAQNFPLGMKTTPRPRSLREVTAIVSQVIDRFRHLVEDHGLNKELYKANKEPKA